MWKKCISLVLLVLFLVPFSIFAKAQNAKTVELPIIMYHKVTKDSAQWGKFAIAPWELEKDLLFLKEKAYNPIFLEELIDFVKKGTALPEKPILLTFDDGFFSDFHYVYPLSLSMEMPVILSIIGIETDTHSKDVREDIILPHLTWAQVKEMVNAGYVDIQNHSYHLHKREKGAQGAQRRPGEEEKAYQLRLGEDLLQLQDALERETGKKPTCFTYPFGAKSESSDSILQALGFEASFMTENRLAKVEQGRPETLFSLPRLIRPHGKSLEEILTF